jgi:hypothetical protein
VFQAGRTSHLEYRASYNCVGVTFAREHRATRMKQAIVRQNFFPQVGNMNEKKVEDPKLVIVYFANGTVQWVKSGSTNQWSRDGGRVNKFFEGRVYQTATGEKIKIKQHFKLLNTVFMDVGTGTFLDTVRDDLLGLVPDPNDTIQHCKWWDVDWSCPIVFEPKPERKPYKSPIVKS